MLITACDNDTWAVASPSHRRAMLVAELAVFFGHAHQPVEIVGAEKPAEPTSAPQSEPDSTPNAMAPAENEVAQSAAQPANGEHAQEDGPQKRAAPGTRRPIPGGLGTLD
ncbi:hypothetical protein ACSZNO_21145 [Aeromonas veronii]